MNSTGYKEDQGEMNTMNWEQFFNGENRQAWGRDLTGMCALRITTWESANLALKDLGLWGQWEMPDSNFNKPLELENWEYCHESAMFDRIFTKYWLSFIMARGTIVRLYVVSV